MRTALVIGGSGMLAGASTGIAALGLETLVPSRHGPAPVGCDWIPADWEDPDGFGATLGSRLAAPVDLLVVWAHHPYRKALWSVLEHHLTESTCVVEVWSHAGARPDEQARLANQVPHHHVVLGRGGSESERWLHDHEISQGVLAEVERALPDPAGSDVTIVGSLDATAAEQVRSSLGFPAAT